MSDTNENPILHEKLSSKFERKIAWLDNLMVVVCEFSGGPMENPEAPHSHPHEQITYVAEGEVEFFKGEEKLNLSQGDLIIIPGGIPHCIRTVSSFVKLIDSFSPIRREFLKI